MVHVDLARLILEKISLIVGAADPEKALGSAFRANYYIRESSLVCILSPSTTLSSSCTRVCILSHLSHIDNTPEAYNRITVSTFTVIARLQ